ncbi:MAG: dethiobiotin synthase [Cellulosilyticaceae bacterium]
MSKGLFIVGTDTDVGKTYVTALLTKRLRESGVNVGYYKAVLSGGYYDGDELIPGDAKEVLETSGIDENYDECVSYILENPVSPHLAAQIEAVDIQLSKVLEDYQNLTKRYEYLSVEGSGGIICPIKLTETESILLEDIIRLLDIPTLVVARAGLGTINHTALTINYLRQKEIPIQGIILNGYDMDNVVHKNNKKVIERLTNIKVIATIPTGNLQEEIDIDVDHLIELYK